MRKLQCGDVVWIDLEKPKRDEVFGLSATFPFHPLNLEDCLSRTQLTKLERHENYLFLVVRFPVKCEGLKCSPSQISFFLGKEYLVTVHDGSLAAIKEVFTSCETLQKQNQKVTWDGVGSLFYTIMSKIVDSLFPVMEELMDRIEDLEDKIFSEQHDALFEVANLRRSVSDLRRILSPFRKVLSDISLGVSEVTGDDLRVYFDDIKDRIERVWELSETCKELVEIFKDTDFTLYQRRMNRALVILTVIFTITIPATIIGTFYGMNIPMPGSAVEPTGELPVFLGPWTTFILVVVLSLLPAVAMLVYFKRIGWI
ncbi:MAG: magnesium transporter CorA family protein [Candidatus Verstraetearchaeota archaeon]|nr:magnesium transporter CorA family protein [Candidatus Verstraetearchaeota archaeon]